MSALSRRGFLGAIGAGGLALGLFGGRVRRLHAQEPDVIEPTVVNVPWEPNVFVHFDLDGTVTITCARTEMGQGVRSSLPMLIADELGADLSRVRVAQGDGDKKYGDQNTDGSTSVRKRYKDLRKFGATARTMLITAAATKWKVPPNECDAADHMVTHRLTQKSLPFADLIADAAKLPLPADDAVQLKPLTDLPHVGKVVPLVDGLAIVTGGAKFGSDVPVDNVLVAVVRRPPDFLGKVASYDDAAATKVPGVIRVVELPSPDDPAPGPKPAGGVAVIAKDTWAALRGREALSIKWTPGPHADYDSDLFREELLATVRKSGETVRNTGDIDGVMAQMKSAGKIIAAEYFVPHLAHVPMEPPSTTARVTANGVEIWAATQHPQGVKEEVAKALGLAEEAVTVHVTLVGGAFGRKSINDFATEAALLSRAVGAPVRMQWTRTDDIQHDYLHPISAQRLEAALDGDGKVVGWLHRTAFPSVRSTFDAKLDAPNEGDLGQGVLDLPLAIPNVRAEKGKAKAHTRIGWMRSVCNVQHAFSVGSFVDEIAVARGVDTRTALLDIVGPPRNVTPEEAGVEKIPNYGQPLDEHPVDVARHRHVIERVTEMAGWGKPTNGRALGLAVHRSFLSSIGVVVAVVASDADPGFAVDEAWVVIDAGIVLNLDRVVNQMEGAVIFGMSSALHGEITVKRGQVQQTNFRDYRIARIGEAPRAIHVEVVESTALPGGVGEPGVPPVAPALANALFALTGRRLRELPLIRNGRLREK